MRPDQYVPRITPPDPRDVPLDRLMAEPGMYGGDVPQGVRLSPPPMPPGYTGSFTCCPRCPYSECERCEPREAWAEFRRAAAVRHELEQSNRRATSLWRRLIAASWQLEDHHR